MSLELYYLWKVSDLRIRKAWGNYIPKHINCLSTDLFPTNHKYASHSSKTKQKQNKKVNKNQLCQSCILFYLQSYLSCFLSSQVSCKKKSQQLQFSLFWHPAHSFCNLSLIHVSPLHWNFLERSLVYPMPI